MQKIIKKISLFICFLSILLLPYFVFAENSLTNNLKDAGGSAGYNTATDETSLSRIAGVAVSTVLGLLGIIFIILIIYAGIMWMTAEGEEAKVEKAQKILKNAIIGLIITVSAYAIYKIVELFFLETIQ
jgi:hypothetical protein